MKVTLTIVRYPKVFVPVALFSMAIFRLPLWLNRGVKFYKLMGCGRNGTFDKNPDWQQWALMVAREDEAINTIQNTSTHELICSTYGNFIAEWFRVFRCETWTVVLEPAEGHGKWDGKEPFGKLNIKPIENGPIAILTRASIRLSKLKSFWQNVGGVAQQMDGAKGFVTSVGIGEMPYIKQATFSIWTSKEAMKAFAYEMKAHSAVIKKTRSENWYSEDMFVRFRIIKSSGTLKGNDPLKGIL